MKNWKRIFIAAASVLTWALTPMAANANIDKSALFEAAPTNAFAAASLAPPASIAGNYGLTERELSDIRSFFNLYGVPELTQTSLFSKLANGKTWDSLKVQSVPISTETTIKGNLSETVNIYEDGSLFVSTVTLPVNQALTRGVGQCVKSVGTAGQVFNNDCLATGYYGVVNQRLYFNYNVAKNGTATITKYWGQK